ncbi:MAG: PocR ligand-binding domain-containing protein [Lachnospiraceae bacterium]|nr:PocR ligand-binding domain-containing protein [Lachnospiraceae bacterium]
MNENIRLVDLVKIETLQQLQDAFSNMTGMAALTTDEFGVAITKGSNFSDFCTLFTRQTNLGCSRCEKCDKYGAELALKSGKSITYFCHAGLVDFAAPIMADGKMLGCFIGGQVLTEPANEFYVRNMAIEIGVNPDEYVKAVRKVNIVPKETIDRAADFLYVIAQILSDITYSRYLAYRAGEELEKAANMKSDFLANMSHEIRTPMNAVIGMAEMALREDLPDNAREYINEIKISGKTLLTIINDILDFSKIESGKMDVVPGEYEPMSVINDVTNIIMTRLENKDLEFILDIKPEIPNKLYGDSDRIKQVILNIVNNAVKFTRKGRVILKVDFTRVSEYILILHVSVTDTGIGIKKEDLSKLFQSFQQLDSKRNRNIEGTGLGLAICKRLLTLMGGHINVESEYGKGSRFSFSFPQRIVDSTPSISLETEKQIVAATLIYNEFVEEELKHSIQRLGAECIELQKEDDLNSQKMEGVSCLFVDTIHFSDNVKWFAETNPHIKVILIIGPNERANIELSNVRIVKKPVYTLNVAMIFNGEVVHYEHEAGENVFDFIAPEAEILIIDDNAINLTVAEGLLEPLKMKIDTAVSGKQAIEKISKRKYDIIFMDHMMPELDGVETTHIIRRFFPQYDAIPIIALTANAVDGTMEMFIKEGMNDFVAKPIELKILVSKVKKWLPLEKVQKKFTWKENEHVDETSNLPQIGDLDVKMAYHLLGSEKLFWSVLKDYYRVIETKSDTIKKHVLAENWPAYTIEVHALKSASKQIGAIELSKKAAELEQAGNESNVELIYAKTDIMLSKYREYIEVLTPYFTENEQENTVKLEVSQENLRGFFEKLRLAMDDLDMDAMECVMEEMNQYYYVEGQQELFEKLKEAVANIDVENCEFLLQKWERAVGE